MDSNVDPYKYIEYLQESVYKYYGIKPKKKDIPDFAVMADDYVATFKQTGGANETEETHNRYREAAIKEFKKIKEPPTRYEEPSQYHLMTLLSKRIEYAASQFKLPLTKKLIFGSLPTGRANAMAVRVPNSDKCVILFESQFFNLIYLFTNLVASAVPVLNWVTNESKYECRWSYSYDSIMENICQKPIISERFFDILYAHLVVGITNSVPNYMPKPSAEKFADLIRNPLEVFVFGHEYGHIIGGHLLHKSASNTRIGIEKVEEIKQSWEHEFEADFYGSQLTITSMLQEGYDLVFIFLGISLFFVCVETIIRGLCIFNGVDYSEEVYMSESHPPPRMRRQALLDDLKKTIPENESSNLIEIILTFEKVVMNLWKNNEPKLKNIYQDGERLSPIWQQNIF